MHIFQTHDMNLNKRERKLRGQSRLDNPEKHWVYKTKAKKNQQHRKHKG